MKRFINQTWNRITNSSLLGRVLVVVIVLAVLATAMILSGPKPPGDFDPFVPIPTPMFLDTTGTPTSPLLSTEYKLTNGVVLAVVSVVLIVLIGTIIYVMRYNKLNRG